MLFFKDLSFEIKYKTNEFCRQISYENLDKFLIAYTTLKEDEIKSLNDEELIALSEDVFERMDMSNAKTFKRVVKNVHSDIKNLAVILLGTLNKYTVNEMLDWDYEKLFKILLLEMAIDTKFKNACKESIPKSFPENNIKEIEEFLEQYYPSKQEQEMAQQRAIQENQQLINQLNNLTTR